MFTSSSLVLLLSAAIAMADNHQARSHHAAIAKRINNTSIEKRDTYTGREMTWYPTDTGADACTGKNHKDSDFFVAMGYDQFGDGGCCGKQLRITYNGKSAVATCVDECASCPEWGQLDLTKGLFEYFTGDLGIGVIYASWSYVDGDDDGPTDDATTTKKATTHHTTSTTHRTTSTTKKQFTATPTHTTSSEKPEHSSAKPTTSESHAEPTSSESSVKHSSSADLLPSISSPTEDPLPSPPLPSPSDDGGVANVGADPGSPAAGSSDPQASTGADSISGALTGSNDGTSLRSNRFTVAIAALALAALQVL